MKASLTTIFFLSSIFPLFSCFCPKPTFCDYLETTSTKETSLIFKGSYLSEEEIFGSTKAVQFKVEKIYRGEIVTENSVHYSGETYINTDSTVWVLSGPDPSCKRFIGNREAIFIVTYNPSVLANEEVGYVPTICATDYFPISDEDEVSEWIWANEEVTISLDEFESLIEQGCETSAIDISKEEIDQPIIYPNPVHDILQIKCSDDSKILSLELYDTQGELLNKSKGTTMDINDLSPGVYFLKVNSLKANYIEKVMKL